MKPKVLFIMHMPPPIHGAAMIGEWIYKSKMINERFDCFYLNPSISTKVTEVGKIKINKIFLFLCILYKIINSIRSIRPTVCYYTPTSDGYGIYKDALVISIIRLFCKKTVLHFHNKGVKKYSSHKMAAIAYRIIFKNVKVILISKELYSDISDYVSLKDVFFLHNAIPQTVSNNKFKIIKQERETCNSSNRLLFLSNLLTTKGIYILLDACKQLDNQGVLFECHYIGNSGDISIETFKSSIIKEGLQNKIFVHGPKYGKDKEIYFINSDIFIFPTYHETFGLVLLEAMEYGLPCITTPEGGIPSIISADNGILVKQKDSHELAIAIKSLIDNEEKRKRMGNNGREMFLKKYTIKTFENNLVNILQKIISI